MTKRLLLLNGLAAFTIAVYHASAYGFSAMFEWTDRYMPVAVPNYDQLGSTSYYFLLTIRQLNSFAIPAFIIVSGYFIAVLLPAARSEERLSWANIIPRLRSLTIPFLVWTAVRYILLRQVPTNLNEFLRHYYFIVLLFQFYLLAPFIARSARKHWLLVLLITGAIQATAETIFLLSDLGVQMPEIAYTTIRMLPLWFFPRRIFWFGLGVVIGFHRKPFREWLRRWRWAILTITLISGALTVFEYEAFARWAGQPWLGPSFRGLSSRLFGIAFIGSFLAFDKVKIPFSKQLEDLAGKSLGIYLVNIPAIYVVAVILYRWLPWALSNQLVYQSVLIVVGIAVPLLLMYTVKNSAARKYYRQIFG